ncbi:cytochrome C oxidase assembly protein [Bacillus sp. AFS018417]|uniref:cytochrome C oxidase assembly protein n=1 Tax=unclassified Bacillus (in: firmicutes) TaxID=185979 RepID=UPI000BF8B290|nr:MULTISPECIES: cytochrome C oxidase assembly protein [unclassified Bacillus (in: firmicutes)]MCP1124891.1 cytochrome C oxidase assembly protein [Bacillus sp. 3103sda1]PEZ10308.1 cytochrome C oxidase assembly protein [Bacillus sp. AFS018417]
MQIGSTILCFFLYTYVIVAAIYFGVSFYTYCLAKKESYANTYEWVRVYVSPVAEIMNAFVLFLFVGLIAFSTSLVGNKTTLFILGAIIFMLLGIRICNMVFWNNGLVEGYTSIGIPGLIAAIVTNIENEYNQLHFWLIIVLTIVSLLYISATFLTYCAYKREDRQAVLLFRKWALFWSVPTMFVIGAIAIIVNGYELVGWQKMFEIWWVFIVSFVGFLGATHYLFHQQHYQFALLFAFIQLLFAFFGQETLVFVFQTFSSFGNIFIFGMLICMLAFYLQQFFYIQKQK